MMIKIDFYSHIPIHAQIVVQIKRLIVAGELAPGERLPTLRQLAAELQINFTTVARAYRALDTEGLISTQHGRGTFVIGVSGEGKSQRLRELSLNDLTRAYVEDSRHLGFDDAAIVRAVWEELTDRQVNEE